MKTIKTTVTKGIRIKSAIKAGEHILLARQNHNAAKSGGVKVRSAVKGGEHILLAKQTNVPR